MSSLKTRTIVGRQPLVEAIAAGVAIDKILLQKNANGEVLNQIRHLSKEHNIPLQFVPVEKLNSLTRSNHQGLIAFAAVVKYYEVQQVIDLTISNGETPLFIMLDGITDVRNIGAIARTALCCGVQAIIIPDKGVGALNEEALKASAGALEHVHVCRVNSLMKTVDELHLNGIKVFASEMKATKSIKEIALQDPCCIVLGGEEKGVYPALMKICDESFHIPMKGKFESLNVSVASGMILYEAMQQRG
jgi:23S rRNA (guanosine2251-2'-O)-methyltransferase